MPLQKIINFIYRSPKAELRKFGRFGGYLNYRRMMQNRRLMEESFVLLPPVASDPHGLSIYFLTGKKYLYQTLFCIQSLSRVSPAAFNFILVDDGSFDESMIQRINKQLPGAGVVTAEIIKQNLQSFLPEYLYPYLHQKRREYPHIKKLTDIHTIHSDAWKLVLDSDMLFWNAPLEIIDWLKNPKRPLYMVDCEESYGYSEKLMEDLSGSKIKKLINVGAIGLNSKKINWENVEKWAKNLEQQEGTSYYLEQALTAMLIGDSDSIILNPDVYIVNPGKEITKNKTGILHHYVDLSKEGYYNTAWKIFM